MSLLTFGIAYSESEDNAPSLKELAVMLALSFLIWPVTLGHFLSSKRP
jgi:hypothetical protein